MLTTFENLDVWKRGCRLAVDVYKSCKDSKDYALRNQMERSAVSIASNIAEGAERDSPGDYVRFLRIAKGSCAELRTQIMISQKISQELNTPSFSNSQEIIKETREISAMLQGLMRSIQNKNNTTP